MSKTLNFKTKECFHTLIFQDIAILESFTQSEPRHFDLHHMDKLLIFDENACSFTNDSSNPKFDLVYCDPPYEKKLGIRSLKNLIKKNMLNTNAIIILEEELKSKTIDFPELEILRIKEIGISKFSFLRLL